MTLGGYANRVAQVDLSSGSVAYDQIPEEWARKYIGARGLGVKYVFENGPEVEPLSPENILCFMNGPLTGSEANMSGRMAIVTKSPLTGTVTDSHHGGWSAARLRWAGFDGLIVKGKAEQPVYLYVENGEAQLRDASELWGLGTHETIARLRDRYGDNLSVIAIGQAGEKRVRFACWMNENDRASGRGGTGAVGGAKNLKAIVIKSSQKMVRAADRDAWRAAHRQALSMIMDENNVTSPRKGGLSVYGTNVLMNITNTIGALPSMNSQFTSFENAELLSGEHVKEHILVEDPTCHACPVGCKKEVHIKEGKYAVRMESVEYEPAWSIGANCGNDNIEAVSFIIDRANDWGYDAIEIGNVMAMYMEATQRGYLPDGAPPLQWGDTDAMVEMARRIAFREGVGDQLAEGIGRFAEALGHPEIGIHVKGQSLPAYDPRGLKGMGLGYATSNRGACHLRGYSPASELGLIGLKTDPLDWQGKGELLKLLQDLHAFSDSLDLCKFSAFAEGAEEYAEQYRVMLGLETFSVADVLTTGERIYNLERHYNNLAGHGEGSDYLPKRFTEEPSTSKGSEGHVCELDQMLGEYYQVRGWQNGVVPEAKLRELEIV